MLYEVITIAERGQLGGEQDDDDRQHRGGHETHGYADISEHDASPQTGTALCPEYNRPTRVTVITSYSIHYTKLYDGQRLILRLALGVGGREDHVEMALHPFAVRLQDGDEGLP